tara:strand:- start:177717 stop:178352 length:636 start_codon:yes stop_codon:yes gene_type:complete
MKRFNVGDWVEITPRKDQKWKYWNNKHESMKGKAAEIERVETSQDGKQTFYYLRDLDGRATWFLDHHMVLTPKQDRRFIDHMRKSCEKLQKHERLCKRLRDEILEDVFMDKNDRLYQDEFWDDDEPLDEDDLAEDWETVVTKPVVPLPGKKTAKTRIKKITKRISKQKKSSTKQSASSGGSIDTSNIDPADFMTDEEIQEYLDDIYGIDWT